MRFHQHLLADGGFHQQDGGHMTPLCGQISLEASGNWMKLASEILPAAGYHNDGQCTRDVHKWFANQKRTACHTVDVFGDENTMDVETAARCVVHLPNHPRF